MRLPGPRLQGKCACGGTCSHCRGEDTETPGLVQRLERRAGSPGKEGTPAPPIVDQALRSSGQPLDPAAQAYFSPRFGHDLSAVRVHTDPLAAESARAVDAFAYTVGRDIVFAPGQYAPGTASGRRLIAHELSHVIQQDGQGTALRRKDTAADAPDLVLSEHSDPCACVVQIHNNESKARKIAGLMHQHCRYNLASLNEGTDRHIPLPGHKETVDPNGLFPADVAEQCMTDPKSCEDFLKDPAKAGAKDEAGVAAFVQRQFFLTIKKCSKDFSLPVISLHTNVTKDTAAYLKNPTRIGEFGSTGLTDIKTGDPADPVAKLKTWLEGFGGGVAGKVLDKDMTNIFVWCDPADVSQCHIGDPSHPDNIVWVTNESDFTKLKAKNVNAVLQTEMPKPKPGETSKAATDLSTLFVVLRQRLDRIIQQIQQDMAADQKDLVALVAEMSNAKSFAEIFEIQARWEKKLNIAVARKATLAQPQAERDRLHFVNVEGPADADVVKNFEALLGVLQTLGFDCCGTTGAEEVRKGLKPQPKPKAKPPAKKK